MGVRSDTKVLNALQNALMVCMDTGVKSSVDIVQTYPSVTTLMDLV